MQASGQKQQQVLLQTMTLNQQLVLAVLNKMRMKEAL